MCGQDAMSLSQQESIDFDQRTWVGVDATDVSERLQPLMTAGVATKSASERMRSIGENPPEGLQYLPGEPPKGPCGPDTSYLGSLDGILL